MLKPPDELGDAEAAAICEIAPGTRPGAHRVRFYDKKAALDAIARHLGMFPAAPRRREETPAADPAEDAREVLARRLARLAAGRSLRNKLVRSLTPDQAICNSARLALLGAAQANCRPQATGASGCCSPGAALARRGPAPSWCGPARQAGRRRRIAFVAPTAADARDVMVEGESGILAISPTRERPRYEPVEAAAHLAERRDRDTVQRRRAGAAARSAARSRLVRRAGRMALSRGLGHADVRAAARARSARRRYDDAAADPS